MIRAIETIWPWPNGYRFRSRLEARWAVFFNALGIEYEYELQGYDIDGIKYLPDFYLPSLSVYFEIKSRGVKCQEILKVRELSIGIKKSVYLVEGDPYIPTCYEFYYKDWEHDSPVDYILRREYVVNRFKRMGRTFVPRDVEHIDEDGFVSSQKGWLTWRARNPDVSRGFNHAQELLRCCSDVELSMLKARHARFEHGETPDYIKW